MFLGRCCNVRDDTGQATSQLAIALDLGHGSLGSFNDCSVRHIDLAITFRGFCGSVCVGRATMRATYDSSVNLSFCERAVMSVSAVLLRSEPHTVVSSLEASFGSYMHTSFCCIANRIYESKPEEM